MDPQRSDRKFWPATLWQRFPVYILLMWSKQSIFTLAGVGIVAALVVSKRPAGAITEALRDPLSILAMRSPGERDGAGLLQTKPAKPVQRVLSGVRQRPVAPAAAEPPGLLTLEDPGMAPPTAFGAIPEEGPLVADSVPGPNLQPIIFNPTPFVVVPDPPAVPEPGTWITMIVGFLGIGIALRRRRTIRQRRSAPHSHVLD